MSRILYALSLYRIHVLYVSEVNRNRKPRDIKKKIIEFRLFEFPKTTALCRASVDSTKHNNNVSTKKTNNVLTLSFHFPVTVIYQTRSSGLSCRSVIFIRINYKYFSPREIASDCRPLANRSHRRRRRHRCIYRRNR